MKYSMWRALYFLGLGLATGNAVQLIIWEREGHSLIATVAVIIIGYLMIQLARDGLAGKFDW